MKQQKLFSKCCAAAACLIGAVLILPDTARAEVYNFNAGGTTNADGFWNVSLNTTDNLNWTVAITPDSTNRPAGSNGFFKPLVSVDEITLNFFDAGNTAVKVDAVGSGRILFGQAWSATGGDTLTYDSPNLLNDLRNGPLAYFSGAFTLKNKMTTGGHVSISLLQPKNYPSAGVGMNKRQWGGKTEINAVTPEMPGACLLFSALFPVALLLRKRNKSQAKI